MTTFFLQEPDTQDSSNSSDEEALDAHGIPGWDKVDVLARALLQLEGLCVTNAQAREIQALYQDLPEHDCKPFAYKPRPAQANERQVCQVQEQPTQ